MDLLLEQVKKLIAEAEGSKDYRKYVKRGRKAERYAKCKNDIKNKRRGGKKSDVFKTACHKISSPFFRMILMQKSSYLFGEPPEIDVGDEEINKQIKEILGSQWGKNLKKLCDVVSIWGDGWIQYWIDDDGQFKYGVIPHSEDVLAGWGGLLDEQLVYCVKRATDWIDPETAERWNLYELWTDEKCSFYRYPSTGKLNELEEELQPISFNADTQEFTEQNFIVHEYGELPFIYFRNNSLAINDLVGVKESIDAYDEARSSLADDIQDCDETIFVLSNNGDQDPTEFWNNVSENRLINLVSDPVDGEIGKSDCKLLAIEPPIAAKQLSMSINKDDIQDLGGIVDPSPDRLGNASGEAIKHTYNILELKACQLEDEFRIGIDRLVKAICRFLNYTIPEGQEIKQTWRRTRINNDTEVISNLANSADMLSQDTRIKMHPYAEPDELEKIAKEKLEQRNEALTQAQQRLIDNGDPYGRNNQSISGLLGTAVQTAGGSQEEQSRSIRADYRAAVSENEEQD